MASIIKADTWQNSAGVTYGTLLQRVVVGNSTQATLQTSTMTTMFSASITPKFANSRIYITINAQMGKRSTGEFQMTCRILRGSTPITQALANLDSASGLFDVYREPDTANAAFHGYRTYWGYDQPNTTSPITYNFQFAQASASYQLCYFNFSNSSYTNIWLEEIAQ